MKKIWKSLYTVFFILGFIFIIASQYLIWQTDRTLAVLTQVFGNPGFFFRMWYDILPFGIVLGIAVFLVGTIFTAIAIQSLEMKKNPFQSELLFSFYQRHIYITAIFLIGASIFLMLPATPGTAAEIVWFLTLIFLGAIFFLYDQLHKTTLGNPFLSRGEFIKVSLIAFLGLILVASDMTSWRWAGTPDELCFFGYARDLGVNSQNQFILSQNGLFGYHPLISHYYQLIIMRLFGMNIFGWRLSSALAFAFAIPFVYLFARDLWNTRTGYIAALLFATTPIALTFAHAGYNNIDVYPLIFATISVFVWSIRRNSVFGYYLTGIIAGLGFYTYYPARLAGVFVILLGFLFKSLPVFKKNRLLTAGFVLGLGITILYFLMNLGDMLQRMLQFTVVKEVADPTAGGILTRLFAADGYGARILTNFGLTLIHGVYTVQGEPNWHFLSNPVLNPFYNVFYFIGLYITITGFFKKHSSCFLILSFLISALVVGGVTDYPRPPLTRLMFFAPFLAIFAAIALDHLWLFLSEKINLRKKAVVSIVAVLVLIMMAWNVRDVHNNVYHLYHGFADGITAEVVKLRQMLPKNYQMVYIHSSRYYTDSVPWTEAYDGKQKRSYCFGGLDNFENDFNKAHQMLQTMAPPFMVALRLEADENDKTTAVKELLNNRFPGMNLKWESSDPGKGWNMEYVFVPAPKN
ncbi:MAG TPA: glycosyltransferase family 39 protein [Bacillota bacterium]|nr:glycosyltransferase family 39 protein [Bacillota bacterium]